MWDSSKSLEGTDNDKMKSNSMVERDYFLPL
jgi:hypothetical protein